MPGDVTVVIHDILPGSRPRIPCCPPCAGGGPGRAPRPGGLADAGRDRPALGRVDGAARRGRGLRPGAAGHRRACRLPAALVANTYRLPPMWSPRRFLTYLRWAWLYQGAAQYFSGQVSLYRLVVITRLREGERPRFRRRAATRSSSGARSSTCSTATAAPKRARCWRRARAGRAPSPAWTWLSGRIGESSAAGAGFWTISSIRRETSPAPTRLSTRASGPRRWTRKAGRGLARSGPRRCAYRGRSRRPPQPGAGDRRQGRLRPDFEDPFEGEPRIRRGSGLSSPPGSDLGPPLDLDFGWHRSLASRT